MTRLVAVIGKLADLALDVLAPPGCSGCDQPCRSQRAFCENCRADVCRPPVDQLDGVPLLSAAVYVEPVSTAIRRLKYENRPDLAGRLAELAVEQTSLLDLLKGVAEKALFVPVPLHPRRLAERGYNQSALVAKALARRAGGEFGASLLERSLDTAQQASLPRAERVTNVAHAFRLRPGRRSALRQIVLVDDVVTTGATARACMSVLADAGAKLVCVVSVARTVGQSARRAAAANMIGASRPERRRPQTLP